MTTVSQTGNHSPYSEMDSRQKLAIGVTALLIFGILFIWEAKLGMRYLVASIVLLVALLLWWPAGARVQAPVRAPRPVGPNPHEQFAESIERLPIDRAREMADSYLSNARFWRLSPIDDHPIDAFERFGPIWQQLLTHYRSIDSAVGEAGLSSVGIQRFDWPNSQVLRFGGNTSQTAEYFRIGTDFDGN